MEIINKPQAEMTSTERRHAYAQPGKSLTTREAQVLTLYSQGDAPAEIAGKLGLATNTINVHLQNCKYKLEGRSMRDTVAKAVRDGVI